MTVICLNVFGVFFFNGNVMDLTVLLSERYIWSCLRFICIFWLGFSGFDSSRLRDSYSCTDMHT